MVISVPAKPVMVQICCSTCPNLGKAFQKENYKTCFKFVNLFVQIVQKAATPSADTQSYNLWYCILSTKSIYVFPIG